MKRSTPLRRTTALRGSKPLRRTTRLRARGNTKYRRRERDFEFMGWVKQQPCIMRSLPPFFAVEACTYSGVEFARRMMVHAALTPCSGPVEADHLGARGMGQKADDRTCAPLCRKHHRERHDHAGSFRPLTKPELRAWRARAIEITQAAYQEINK